MRNYLVQLESNYNYKEFKYTCDYRKNSKKHLECLHSLLLKKLHTSNYKIINIYLDTDCYGGIDYLN